MACRPDGFDRAPQGSQSRFRVRERIQGLTDSAQRELVQIQRDLKRELSRAENSPRFAQVQRASYMATAGEFVRAAPRGPMTVVLEEPRRENQGQETRVMVEDLSAGELFVKSIRGTVDLKPTATVTAPGLIVATSNGVNNWSLTLFVGSGTDGPTGAVNGNTVRGNPQALPNLEVPISLPLHSVLLRGAGNLVARSLVSLFADRLTYDEATNTVSADDQTSALTASNGVTRNTDNFEEEAIAAQSVKVNATDAVARPLPNPLGAHTFLANVGSGIVSRALQTFYGAGITYDEPSGTVSVDPIDVGLTDSNEGLEDDGTTVGIADGGVTNAKLADMPEQSVKICRAAGQPVDLPIGANRILARSGTGDVDDLVIPADGVARRDGAGDLLGGQLVTGNYSVSSVTLDKIEDLAANSIWARGGTSGQAVEVLINTHSFYGRKGGSAGSQTLDGLAGSNLIYNAGTGQFDASDQLASLSASGGVDRVGDDFRLSDMAGFSIRARDGLTGAPQDIVLGDNSVLVNRVDDLVVVGLAEDTVLGRAGTGVINDIKLRPEHWQDTASLSMFGRAATTSGPIDEMRMTLANSLLARVGSGDIVNVGVSSGNMLANDGSGLGEVPIPPTVPESTNAVITRNSAGNLAAASMPTNGVLIRQSGSPFAVTFGSDHVLRSVSGTLGVGLLVTNNLGNGIVTAAKTLLSDSFSWTGLQSFGGNLARTSVQTSSVAGGVATLSLGAGINVLRISGGSSPSLAGLTGGFNGREVLIQNTNVSTDIILFPNDGAVTASNRFAATVADRVWVLPAGAQALVSYNSTASRWFPSCTTIEVTG